MVTFPNHYDQIYIVCFPVGAGGSFLINCLALSDDCVFSNDQLARQQLQGQFDLGKKQDYLADMLAHARRTGVWRDLGLSNSNLFGFDFLWEDVDSTFLDIIQYQVSSIVNKLIPARKKFFLVCHDINTVPQLRQMWPCAKIIMFLNYRSFINKRPPIPRYQARQHGLHQYWQTVKDPSWPDMPPATLTEFKQLPDTLQQELVEDFDFDISRWFDFYEIFDSRWAETVKENKLLFRPDAVTFDVGQAYQSSANLQSCLSELAEKLGLNIVDRDIISWYYNAWFPIVTGNIKQYESQRSFI